MLYVLHPFVTYLLILLRRWSAVVPGPTTARLTNFQTFFELQERNPTYPML
jgi:hypothetical protein